MPKRRRMSKEEVGQVELSDPQSDEDNEQFRDSASDEEGDNAIEHDESMYDGDNADEGQSADEQSDNLDKSRKKKIRKLKLDTTQDFNTTLSKRGILYLSRIPPRMGPSKIKSLLSDFGPITRIYLAEEDKVLRKKRRKAGGSGFKRYTEGWVEFESKKVAKLVGETLNMSRVAGNKRSLHYDDLWNVKVGCYAYLLGCLWHCHSIVSMYACCNLSSLTHALLLSYTVSVPSRIQMVPPN